ncbi:hypothetical protein [Parvularcula sp. LCG005]|uniref:hypothetical protein n=1 Tax=Parvularcula sp. LCG005 TaxID=3078805 RepID=UPI002942D437|nr:hypothetical protein [Parvularcula sp. LCG005]WOI52244.1 hypothetical protein RUI03_08775 [Parvularcula sp. LCG005]
MQKSPGEYSPLDMMGMGLAAAVGIAAATFFDLTQSDEASTLFVFNKWLARLTEMLGLGNIPLYGVVLILMGIGALSILYFQPVTIRGAFAQGFGVLAAVTTLAPSDLGGALPSPDTEAASLEPLPAGDNSWFEEEGISSRGLVPPVYRVPVSSVTAVQRDEQGYSIRMKIIFPDGLDRQPSELIDSGDLRGKLHNEESKQTYNLFRNSGADVMYRDGTMYLSSRIPGDIPRASLVARVEAEGYRIVESRFDASLGVNPVWTIRMAPSSQPLLLQRLRRPYWF